MTPILRPLLALCLLVALTAGTNAEDLRDENVLAPLPEGFKIAAQGRNGDVGQSEFIPEGETANDWSRMITVSVMFGSKNIDPDAANDRLAQAAASGCPNMAAVPVRVGTENGYAFSLWLFSCDLNPATGKPESFLSKYVSGGDSLYNVQYAFRTAFTNDMVVEASTYLRKVLVCDTRLKDRPCPPGM